MFSKELPKSACCAALMNEIQPIADKYLGTYPECLPYTLFCEFAETGERPQVNFRSKMTELVYTVLMD